MSETAGLDAIKDCPFTLVEIKEMKKEAFDNVKTYEVSLAGHAKQYTFIDQAQVIEP